eukprot:1155891-Pelagomonas_calceolata.AAC.8
MDWAKAHMGHENPNSGKMAEMATSHQPLAPNLVQRVVRYGALVVKTRVCAAANWAVRPNWQFTNSSATDRKQALQGTQV